MFISPKEAAEAIAEIASKAGIQSEGGKLLAISEGFLAFILVVVVGVFSVEYVALYIVYSLSQQHEPHSSALVAFFVGIGLVGASLIFVFVREFIVRPPGPRS